MAAYDIQPGRLVVCGSLDSFGRDTFYEMSLGLLSREKAPQVVLDLQRVTYISSDCVGVISTLWLDACEAEKKLHIVPSHPVRKILALAGFDKVFELGDA